MIENPDLVEQVFKPGNLVYGGNLEHFIFYLLSGIRTPKGAFNPAEMPKCYTPENICLGLLSQGRMPERYRNTLHTGPYGMVDWKDLAIIINGEKARKKLGDEVFAVGEAFHNMEADLKYLYDYDENADTVFGFPIKKSDVGRWPFVDEVRVYPKDVTKTALTVDTWDGIMIRERLVGFFPKLPVDHLSLLQIPVLTKDFRPVTKDLRELLAA